MEAEEEFEKQNFCKRNAMQFNRGKSFMPSLFKTRGPKPEPSEEKMGSFMIGKTDHYQRKLL